MLDPLDFDYQEIFTEPETIVIEHIIDEEEVMFPVGASQLDIKNLGAAMQLRQERPPAA